MMESHVNHLGRQTSETLWILQDELARRAGVCGTMAARTTRDEEQSSDRV